MLLDDEQWPQVRDEDPPHTLTWTSLWPRRPEVLVRFDLAAGPGGTDLRWTLLVDEPPPDDSLTGHLRKRMNELINRDLRYSYGQ